jgi:phosphoribosyl-AMP cyclohydrolase
MVKAVKLSVKDLFGLQKVWPVIVIERRTKRVIGLQEVDEKALRTTLRTGICHYWDGVNKVIYLKGEHSREIETLRELRLDSCHARRHVRALHFLVDVDPEGKCLFGMDRCDFYRFDGKYFRLDDDCIGDEQAYVDHQERVHTLLDGKADRKHQRRYLKKKA